MKFLILALLAAACFAVSATQRSPAQVHSFMKMHPCPAGADKGSIKRCRGYIVDHILPLDCGGKDAPSNMQWQTVHAAKMKDQWERNGVTCKHPTHGAKVT